MRINRNPNRKQHFLNKDKVVVKHGWHEDLVAQGSAHYGVGDSLGRNAYAIFAYDEDRASLLEGLKSFFTYQRTSPETGSHWYVKRYPRGEGYAVRGNSRDHTLKALFALLMYDRATFDTIVKDKAKRPCIDHPYGVDKKVLLKSYTSDFWSWIYASIYTFKAIFRRLGMWLFRLTTLRHLRSAKDIVDFDKNRPVAKNKWAAFVSKKQLIFPTYALLYGAVVRHGMKSEAAKRYTFFLDRLFGFADKGNHVLKALYGKQITDKTFKEHKYCNKNRWSCRLDFTNDRTIIPVKPTFTSNVYQALFKSIYENQKKYGRRNPFGLRN